jgi:hypothetical protein
MESVASACGRPRVPTASPAVMAFTDRRCDGHWRDPSHERRHAWSPPGGQSAPAQASHPWSLGGGAKRHAHTGHTQGTHERWQGKKSNRVYEGRVKGREAGQQKRQQHTCTHARTACSAQFPSHQRRLQLRLRLHPSTLTPPANPEWFRCKSEEPSSQGNTRSEQGCARQTEWDTAHPLHPQGSRHTHTLKPHPHPPPTHLKHAEREGKFHPALPSLLQ